MANRELAFSSDSVPDRGANLVDGETMIEVRNLSKVFGHERVVDEISFRLRPGRIVAVLGLNGAGKSTLMKMLAGFIQPTSGTGVVAGIDINRDPVRLRSAVGYLPESVVLYGGITAREYLDLFEKLRQESCPGILEEKRHLVNAFKMENALDKRIADLSKGMARKLLTIIAFMGEPSVLLLDEPLDGLDVAAQDILYTELRCAKHRGATVVFSSHAVESAESVADEIMILHFGKLLLFNKNDLCLRGENSKDLRSVFWETIESFAGRGESE